MKPTLIVETRDAMDARDVDWMAGLAAALNRNGRSTAVLLAENGVFAARAGASGAALASLVKARVEVFADRFALAERGIRERDLAQGVTPVEIDFVLTRLEAGAVVMWR